MVRHTVLAVLAACGSDQRGAMATPSPEPAAPTAMAPTTATAPTHEQCDRLLGHLIDLEFAQTGKSHDPTAARSVFDAKRDEFRLACAKAPRARIECALDGRDLPAVAKCDDTP